HTRSDRDWSSDVCSSDLAEKVWRLKSGWGVAHDFSHWLTVSLNADYNHSIAERDGVPPQRYLELSLPATVMHAQYKTTVDFENRSEERRVGKGCRCRCEL